MNGIIPTISKIQNKLIALENYIEQNSQETTVEKVNSKIAKIQKLASEFSYSYSSSERTKFSIASLVKSTLSQLESKDRSCLKKEIQTSIGLIQIYLLPGVSFDERDLECAWLYPTIISLFRASNTRVLQLKLGPLAYRAVIESDYALYEWMPKLAVAEMMMISESKTTTRELVEKVRAEGMAILKEVSDKLRYQTHNDQHLLHASFEASIIPQFHALCSNYIEFVDKIPSMKDSPVRSNLGAVLLGENVANSENEELFQEVLKIIQPMAHIIVGYNREIFCSLMNLSLATNYPEAKQQAAALKIHYFVSCSKEMPLDQAFELYQRLLAYTTLKQEDYEELNNAMADHPELATASLQQVLFLIGQAPIVSRKIMSHVESKGVLSYPEMESLNLGKYTLLLCSAMRWKCHGVCHDLLQLKQYDLFRPQDHYFSLALCKALECENFSVFESLVQHPAFLEMSWSRLDDYIQEVKALAENSEKADSWKEILASMKRR